MENQTRDKKYILNGDYCLTDIQFPIGKGTTAQAFKAASREDKYQKILCAKRIQKNFPQLNQVYQKFLLREIQILKMLNHPNICKMHEFRDDDPNYFYIIQEYCERGELIQRIKQKVKKSSIGYILDEQLALFYMKQIVNAFRYIHFERENESQDEKIIHRDIKLENIFVGVDQNGDDQIKIGDFGFARTQIQNQSVYQLQQDRLAMTKIGSLLTMAPEVFILEQYDERCDIYSLGASFYQMLFSSFPYDGNGLKNITQNIKSKPLELERYNIIISPDMKDLLIRMLTYYPSSRMNFKQLCNHKFFKKQMNQDKNRPQLMEIKYKLQALIVGSTYQIIDNFIYEFKNKFQDELMYIIVDQKDIFSVEITEVLTEKIQQENENIKQYDFVIVIDESLNYYPGEQLEQEYQTQINEIIKQLTNKYKFKKKQIIVVQLEDRLFRSNNMNTYEDSILTQKIKNYPTIQEIENIFTNFISLNKSDLVAKINYSGFRSNNSSKINGKDIDPLIPIKRGFPCCCFE